MRESCKPKPDRIREYVKTIISLYPKFFLDNPDFFKLWLANLVSRLGTWFTVIARLTLFYQLTNSPVQVTTLAVMTIVPQLLVSPIGGFLADWGRKKHLLVIAEALQGALVLSYPFIRTGSSFYLVAFVQAAISMLFSPARFSIIPEMVKEDDIVTANSLDNMAQNFLEIAGPAIAGAFILLFGVIPAFFIDSATYFASALLLAAMTLHLKSSKPRELAIARAFREAATFSFKVQPLVGLVLLAEFLTMLGGGAINSLLIVFTKQMLRAEPSNYSFLLSLGSSGALLGSLVLSQVGKMIRRDLMLFIGYLLVGSSLLSFSFSRSFTIGSIIFFINGISNSFLQVGLMSTLMESTGEELRGKVFSFYMAIHAIGSLFSLLSARMLLNIVGVDFIFPAGSSLILIVGMSLILIYVTRLTHKA